MIIRLYLPNPSWNFEHFSQYALYIHAGLQNVLSITNKVIMILVLITGHILLLTLVVTCPIHILVMSNTCTCFSKLLSNTCFSKLLNLFEFFFETIYTYSQSCLNLACNIGKGEHVNCETHVLTLKRSHNLDKIC